MEIILGSKILYKDKIIIGKFFSEAFYQWLKYFSKDVNKLVLAFENSFVEDKLYFVICADRIC